MTRRILTNAAGAPLSRYFARVHAMNRHAGYGVPVEVLAASRTEAISRAIDVGWGDFQRYYARVTIDKIVDEVVDDGYELQHL